MFQYRRGAAAALLTDPGAIAALASPVRQEVFDTIDALGGTATIAELAAQLGRPADGLYYHVEVLRRAGLLSTAPDGRSHAGRPERRYRIPVREGMRVSLGYRPREPRNAAAVRGVVGGMLRIARRDFDRALAGDAVIDGARRELWAARRTGWVSDADLAAINRLLRELLAHLGRPRDESRRRMVSLCFVLAPMTARPTRRGAAPNRAADRPKRSGRSPRPAQRRTRRSAARDGATDRSTRPGQRRTRRGAARDSATDRSTRPARARPGRPAATSRRSGQRRRRPARRR